MITNLGFLSYWIVRARLWFLFLIFRTKKIVTLIFLLIAFWNWPGAGAENFEGSEPEPPKNGTAPQLCFQSINLSVYQSINQTIHKLTWFPLQECTPPRPCWTRGTSPCSSSLEFKIMQMTRKLEGGGMNEWMNECVYFMIHSATIFMIVYRQRFVSWREQ